MRLCFAPFVALSFAVACSSGGKNTHAGSDAHAQPDAGEGQHRVDAGTGSHPMDSGAGQAVIDAGSGGPAAGSGGASAMDAGAAGSSMDASDGSSSMDAAGVSMDSGTTHAMDAGHDAGHMDGTGGHPADAAPVDTGVADEDSGLDAAIWPNPIARENAMTGTSAWILGNPATANEIEGYASRPTLNAGESVDLYVNTASASYTVEVYRLGWYGGLGARLIVPTQTRTGVAQTIPTPDADGLIECHWTDPVTIATHADWVSGVYLAKLTASATSKQAYIPFVVRSDARSADYLFQSSVTTMQAYNNWGGKSLYDFNSTGPRASKVSFHRPYGPGLNPEAAAGVGAGEILTTFQAKSETEAAGWEYNMIRFLEREAVDVSYVTSVDTHRDPLLLRGHKAFFSVGHDEYWSWEMRRTVEDGRDRYGTSVAFFSGNDAYWQIRFEPQTGPDALTRVVCYKDAPPGDPVIGTADEYLTTIRWTRAPLLRPESALHGLTFQDFSIDADLVVDNANHWIYAGTGLAHGDHIAQLVGYEVDGLPSNPSAGVLRFAHSPWMTTRGSGNSDMISFAPASGADVVAVGSIQFALGLDDFRAPGVVGTAPASTAAQTMARNVLARFAAPRSGPRRSRIVLDERFDAARDPLRWRLATISEGAGAYDPAVAVAQVGERLQIAPLFGTTGLHHAGYVSTLAYDLTGAAVQAEVVQTASNDTAADTTFSVGTDASNFYRFSVEAHTLTMQRNNAGSASSQSLAYNAVAHRFWRMRHDLLGNAIVWETSPDGLAWTVRRSESVSLPLRALYVELEAGTYEPETAPGAAIFDNLRIDLIGIGDGFEVSRDPEHFMPELVQRASAFDPLVPVFPFAGQLHIRPRAATAGASYGGYASTRAWDFTATSVSLEVAQVASGNAVTALAVTRSATDYARVAARAGTLSLEACVGGNVSSVNVTYDAVAQRFWRIRHSTATDELVWETSPDGLAWNEQRRISTPIALDAVRVELFAGTDGPEAAPGEALLDNFMLAR